MFCPPAPRLSVPFGAACTSQRVGMVGEKCDLALGSSMFLLRLRLSVEVGWMARGETMQGTHERFPLSTRKDVRSTSNEDQNE